MYGRTAVDLISVAGSLLDACRFLDFVMLVTNEYGYPLGKEQWLNASFPQK